MTKKVPSKIYDFNYESGQTVYESELKTKTQHIISIYIDESVTKSDNLITSAFIILDDIEELFSKSMNKLIEIANDSTHENYQTIKDFIDFHLEELDEEIHPQFFGVENVKNLTLIEVVKLLKPKGVGVHMEEEQDFIITLDFTYNIEMTDQLLAVTFDSKANIISIAWES